MAISNPSDIAGLVLDIDPHKAAWQDSAGSIPAAINDPVGRVDDQTENGWHIIQNATGSKPTLIADPNGWRILDLDGVDDYLFNASFRPTTTGAQPFTFVVVARAKGTSTVNPLWGHGSGNGDYRQRDSRDYQLNFGSNLRQGIPNTNLRVHHTEVNGASSAIYIDNALLSTAGNPTTPGDAGSNNWTDGLFLGTISSRAQFAFQQFWRVLAFDRLLTSGERSDLYAYLDTLYNNPPPGETPEPITVFPVTLSLSRTAHSANVAVAAPATSSATEARNAGLRIAAPELAPQPEPKNAGVALRAPIVGLEAHPTLGSLTLRAHTLSKSVVAYSAATSDAETVLAEILTATAKVNSASVVISPAVLTALMNLPIPNLRLSSPIVETNGVSRIGGIKIEAPILEHSVLAKVANVTISPKVLNQIANILQATVLKDSAVDPERVYVIAKVHRNYIVEYQERTYVIPASRRVYEI